MNDEAGQVANHPEPTYDGSMYLVGYSVVAAFGAAIAAALAAIVV